MRASRRSACLRSQGRAGACRRARSSRTAADRSRGSGARSWAGCLEGMPRFDHALPARLAPSRPGRRTRRSSAARAVQRHPAAPLAAVPRRARRCRTVVARHALQQREGVGVAAVPALSPRRWPASGEGDHALRVEHRHLAEAVAARAGAHRRVEREQRGSEFRQRVAAHRAGERLEKMLGPSPSPARWRDRRRCAARLEALGQALLQSGAAP